MSLPAQPPPPPPPSRHREHETLIQYNLRNKVCAYCKRPGALLKCEGCRQRSYCDRKCQKRDWKQEHRGQCVKLQQVFMPPPPGWGGAAAEAGGGGGGGKAAAAAVDDEDEDGIENPCPICLDNEDDATVDGSIFGMCSACGQFYCGACNEGEERLAGRSPNCPTCRAPFRVSDDENFKRLWKVVHDRSPGRHTPAAQYNLGTMYYNGNGVEQDYVKAAKWYRRSAKAGHAKAQNNLGLMYDTGKGVQQDHVEAAKWFRKSAEAGNAMAQNNLGIMYRNGKGVELDFCEALMWMQLAAEQGYENALKALDVMQQHNGIPTPPPGTAVTTILLTSAKATNYNNKAGKVVEPTEGAAIKPGRAAVLLDGEAAPISLKLMNLRVHPTTAAAPMSLPAQPPPPPPYPHHEHETLIQYNLRNKVCAYCKRPGARLKCEGCRQRSYCDRKCQKRDWKQEHRGQCVKLQQVFVPPPPGWRGAAAEAGGGGGGGKAAAAAVDVDDDELENPCPICLDNEDDAAVNGAHYGMCTACGQSYCGACNTPDHVGRLLRCPTCRAPIMVSDEENFKQCWKLVHDRSLGRHTRVAQNTLGYMYGNGKGVEQDHVEAAKWHRKSAEAGNAMAQNSLGAAYVNGRGVEQDHVEAAKWYRKAAEAGNAVAQCSLGTMYRNGEGVKQDHVEAAKWYREAAEAGDAIAQNNLGAMYNNGKGVEQDNVESAKWYRKAAEAGYAAAQNNLGNMYRNGNGVEQDHVEAVKWFRKSAEAGDADAQFNLGCMYNNGKGVEQDHVEAAKWSRKSAEARNATAQYTLGFAYRNGEGVAQDHVEAA
eukprot:gene32586-biopygen10500